MRKLKQFSIAIAAGLIVGAIVAQAGESKYAASTDATACAITLAPHVGTTLIKSMQTSCDTGLGAVSIYARSGAGRVPVTHTNYCVGTTNIPVANASYGLTNGDTVVYVYANGAAPAYKTIGTASTTNITLTATITSPQIGDAVYEVSLAHKVVVAGSGAGPGTNALADLENVYISPGDSPLYLSMPSVTNTCLSATFE
jgi:hypothetical protein